MPEPAPQPEEITISLPHANVTARAWGDPGAPPVLALHGWQDNAASFDLLAPRLPGLRLVAIDLVGHGLSDHRPAGTPYSFVDWVVDAHDAALSLGWERFGILGHSLGAGLGAAVAGAWPDRVERLVLVDGFAPKTQPEDELPARIAEFVDRRRALDRQSERRFPNVDAAAERLVQKIKGLPEAAARILAARGTRPIEGGVTWRRDPRVQVGPPARLTGGQIQALLARITCPTLLIRPRGGWPVPQPILDGVVALIQDSEYVEIDGGHHVHLEHPEAVAGLAGPFLRA